MYVALLDNIVFVWVFGSFSSYVGLVFMFDSICCLEPRNFQNILNKETFNLNFFFFLVIE